MFNDINLNNLKYFYEVAECLNITKAASNLNMSQPALTHTLHELESSLDTKLFIRSKKGVSLTESGVLLLEYTKNTFGELNKLSRVLKDSELDKHVYIGATTTNFLEPIEEKLRNFKNINPDVKIEIVVENLETLKKLKALNKLDILITNDYETMEDMEIISSFKIEDVFVASSKYFSELKDKTYSLNELLEYPFVLLSNASHGRKNFNNYLKLFNINFKPTYEFNSYSLCRELIKCGFGVGIGNPIHYNNDDFIIIKTDFNLPTRVFNIMRNKESNNEYSDILINMLKD